MRSTQDSAPTTTVMTGNTTRWFVEKVLPGAPEKAAQHQQLGSTIAAFVAGCACGAFGVVRFGFVVLIVPAVFVIFARSRVPESKLSPAAAATLKAK